MIILTKEQRYILHEIERMFRERNQYLELLDREQISETSARERKMQYTFASDEILDDRLAAYERIMRLVRSRLDELKDQISPLTEVGLEIWDGGL